MIESVRFRNFKVLRDTTLPLGRITIIVGPNGSGKSTAIEGILGAAGLMRSKWDDLRPVEARGDRSAVAEVALDWGPDDNYVVLVWRVGAGHHTREFERSDRGPRPTIRGIPLLADALEKRLERTRRFLFDAHGIAAPVTLEPDAQLAENGGNLANVLDRLRDQAPERFEALNRELSRWIPEFDRVLFETPRAGTRSFLLRTGHGGHRIAAHNLSSGTLFALAVLTLAYLPEPPPLVCLEEPDHGIHPRLLRDVRDALYRLAYPDQFGESRSPTQVIATTHSPYLLDLFRDHPEEIVIANKHGSEATFERLVDRPDFKEILGECSLGDAWYSGVLGGVPAER
jgi:predicted ATPase